MKRWSCVFTGTSVVNGNDSFTLMAVICTGYVQLVSEPALRISLDVIFVDKHEKIVRLT